MKLSVQLNDYEAARNFIQLSQNLTSDCLLISVFLPVFYQFLDDVRMELSHIYLAVTNIAATI